MYIGPAYDDSTTIPILAWLSLWYVRTSTHVPPINYIMVKYDGDLPAVWFGSSATAPSKWGWLSQCIPFFFFSFFSLSTYHEVSSQLQYAHQLAWGPVPRPTVEQGQNEARTTPILVAPEQGYAVWGITTRYFLPTTCTTWPTYYVLPTLHNQGTHARMYATRAANQILLTLPNTMLSPIS